MSYLKPTQMSSHTPRKTLEKSHARMLSQTTLDSELNTEYEESGNSFDYFELVKAQRTTQSQPEQPANPEKVIAYLQQIQSAKLIQPFGCLLALDEKSFNIIAFSENAPEMLMAISPIVPNVDDAPTIQIGTNVQSIFSSPTATSLHKALNFDDVSLLNPIVVQCKTSGKQMYAIVHRSTGCLVVDFEPVKHTEFPSIATGLSQSYKHAAKAVSKIQSLPGGSMQILFNTMVKEVFDLTGYDRVMAYKFHEDDHGEVIAEITKPGLEPYLGLHYPATDIPQAARVLFMKNKVRIICDSRGKSVKTVEAKGLPFDISLSGSTLRAPHSCHLEYMENMNSIASLVMAVVVNENTEEEEDVNPEEPPKELNNRRLWGLIVCHHESPRYVPFPVRYACEFLAEVFAVHVNNEFLLEKQIRERSILDVQTMLSDMVFIEASPLSIISRSPNIMDLVKCDGAALLHGGKVWRLCKAPTEPQIRDIALWLSEAHRDSTGLSTDSLLDAGYPGAASLGGRICGMAMAKIAPNDIVFWFRSHTAADIKWGGAKHDPSDQDDNRRMHPRLSFMAFLEVVKMKSLSWNDYEMDAIYSLQLILRDKLNGAPKPTGAAGLENLHTNDMELDCLDKLHMITSEMVRLAEATGAPILAVQDTELLNECNQNNTIKPAKDTCLDSHKLDVLAKMQTMAKEMARLMETATVPIFAVDANGLVSGWNLKLVELTGLTVQETIGKHILTLVEKSSFIVVQKMLYLALEGKEEKEVRFGLKPHSSRTDDGPVILIANACSSRDIYGHVTRVCFVAQDMTVHKLAMDKFTRVDADYKAIIHNPNPLIPPIFGSDKLGFCSEWNAAMTKLTGFHRYEVLDKMLVGEVFDSSNGSCLLRNHNSFVRLCIIICSALAGKQTDKARFGFYNRNGKYIKCILSAYGKENTDGVVDGVFCFIHVPSQELQNALHVKQASEQTTMKKMNSYMRHAINNNPLSGLIYSIEALKSTGLNKEQMRYPNVADRCHHQLDKIFADIDHDKITDESSFCFELEMVEFVLQDVVEGAVSQVLKACQDKGIGVLLNLPERFMNQKLYGDGIRLQQILSDILFVSVKFSTVGGSIEISCNQTENNIIGKSINSIIDLELRINHKGLGVHGEILSETCKDDEIKDMSWEGLSLVVSRYLLKLMNGDIHHVRKAGTSTFILTAELASAPASN